MLLLSLIVFNEGNFFLVTKINAHRTCPKGLTSQARNDEVLNLGMDGKHVYKRKNIRNTLR